MAGQIIEEALTQHLRGGTVGDAVSDRIYPGGQAEEEAAKPFIVLTRRSTSPFQTFKGSSGRSEATIEVDVVHKTFAGARRLADDVRLELQGYSGPLGQIADVGILLSNDADSGLANKAGQPVPGHVTTLTFSVNFTQDIPTGVQWPNS